MTYSEIWPSHVTLTLTLSVQGYTVSYVYLCVYVCSQGMFSNYVAALQSGHTVFSGFLYSDVTMATKKWSSLYKLTPTIHLDMIYWCIMVLCVLDLHFMLGWQWLGRNGRLWYDILVYHIHWDYNTWTYLAKIYWCHRVVCDLDLYFRLEWPW